MSKAVSQYAERGNDFYPTPDALIDRMLSGVNWRMIQNILEPSAGKGDIAHRILVQNYTDRYNAENQFNGISIDCIEVDPQLARILKYNFSYEKAGVYQSELDSFVVWIIVPSLRKSILNVRRLPAKRTFVTVELFALCLTIFSDMSR